MSAANVILVGNPNTGKTTLFNTLTKSNEKASNWHGVTVGVKSKAYKHFEKEFVAFDTPGVYSLEGFSNEEKITAKFLEYHKQDLIVNICDANNFERNFILTKELIEGGFDVLIVVNMSGEACLFNYEKLSKKLGVDIIEIDARKNKSVNVLKDKIIKLTNKKPQKTSKTNKITINISDFKQKNAKNPYKTTEVIDKFILNKWFFGICFIFVIFMVFYLVYGVFGMWFSNIITSIFSKIIGKLQKIIYCINIPIIIKMMICEGLFGATASVISFVPQIILLMFFINLLEDIGFMSRIAFMFDGLMKKVGLTGKSLLGIIMGYGCTSTAVLATRNLENISLRKRTVLLLPYSNCSAKLPIFLTISSLFFSHYKFLFVFGLYLLSIFIQIIYAIILNKVIKTEQNFMLFELPKYRLPSISKISKDTFAVLKDFVLKTGRLLIVFGLLIWVLNNFDTSFNILKTDEFSKSILYFLSSKISFLFKPLGLGNPAIGVVLFFGLVAKEMLLVGLSVVNGVSGGMGALATSLLSEASVCSFTLDSSIVFLIFIMFYAPCFSAILTIKTELGAKYAIFVFVIQFVIAYAVALFARLLLVNFNFAFWLLAVIVLAIILFSMLKSNYNKKCMGNCNACRNIQGEQKDKTFRCNDK